MTIRLEFAHHKTPRFIWAVRLCKKFPTYEECTEDGLKIYSIEFTEKEIKSFEAIYRIIYGLPTIACFVDGKLIPPRDIFEVVREYEKRARMDRWLEQQTNGERARALFHADPNDAFLARLRKHGIFNPN